MHFAPGAMFDTSIYYCWNCDAHRKAIPGPQGQVACPRCGHELPADSRLPIRATALNPTGTALRTVWPAPMRPRLAAGA
jgi:uncharacterized paraquat-inducible protein A